MLAALTPQPAAPVRTPLLLVGSESLPGAAQQPSDASTPIHGSHSCDTAGGAGGKSHVARLLCCGLLHQPGAEIRRSSHTRHYQNGIAALRFHHGMEEVPLYEEIQSRTESQRGTGF